MGRGEGEEGWAGREGSGTIVVLTVLCVPGWVAWAAKTVPSNLTVASFRAKAHPAVSGALGVTAAYPTTLVIGAAMRASPRPTAGDVSVEISRIAFSARKPGTRGVTL